MKSLSKYKYFKSKTHSCFEKSNIGRYNILNPSFDEIDEMMRKFFNNYV